ncbi:hypothetical protein LTS15_006738 [Exophiala xenobiotica]|nr:hypothetical protein LTS15_006738 [Exophiala xenobiotica]
MALTNGTKPPETPEPTGTTNTSTSRSDTIPIWAQSARADRPTLLLHLSLPSLLAGPAQLLSTVTPQQPVAATPPVQPSTETPPVQPSTETPPVQPSAKRVVLQQLDREARRHLSPLYTRFHDDELQYHPKRIFHPWKPEYRTQPSPPAVWSYSCFPTSAVDYEIPDASTIRVYTPEGGPPKNGLPALLWCSGGGMVLGDIESDHGMLTRLSCVMRCAVVQINYRRAPEHPFPTPVNDVAAAYEFIYRNRGPLGLNGCFVLGGTSAGANLAFVTVLQRIQAKQQIPTAVLFVAPAQLDNTLTLESSTGWKKMKHAPWTGVDTVMSFRELYLPNGAHPLNWQQNPLNFPDVLLDGVKFPPTFNLLMGVDLFLEEGKMLTNRLLSNGTVVEEKIFPGLPHMALGMGRMFPEVLEHISNILRTIFTVDDYMYTGLYTDLPLPQDRSDRSCFKGLYPISWPDSLITNVFQAHQLRSE